MGRKYRRLYPAGRSAPRVAIMRGICVACAKPFEPGEEICFDNRPYPKARYHAACESVDAEAPEAEKAEAIEEAEESRERTHIPERHAVEEPEEKGSIDHIIDERIRRALGSFKPEEAVTADRVKSLARDAASEAMDEEAIRKLVAKLTAPATVTFKFQKENGKTVAIDGAHYMLPRIVNLVRHGFHVALWGGAGGGKTTAAIQVAEALERSFEMDTLDPSTFKSGLQGFMNAAGKFVEVPFVKAWRDGQIYIAEELDCAPGGVQNLLNTALAGDYAPTAKGKIEKGEGFGFIGTMNTPGRPTPEFSERKVMGHAFKDRLYFVYWPQDENIENRAAGLPCDPPPERVAKTCTPAEWVTWVKAIRAYSKRQATTIHGHTGQRAALNGLKALAIGETPEEVADALVFKGADEALREKCLAACPLPGKEI
jgi:MoxR-like ATPase